MFDVRKFRIKLLDEEQELGEDEEGEEEEDKEDQNETNDNGDDENSDGSENPEIKKVKKHPDGTLKMVDSQESSQFSDGPLYPKVDDDKWK